MERMTRSECIGGKTVAYLRDGITIGQAIAYLAAYENTGISPEDLQEAVDILSSVFAASDLPTELKSWAERCAWHVRQCDKLRKKFDIALSEKAKLEAELSIAKRDIAAIIWLAGECRYCKYAKKVSYSGAEQLKCALGSVADCRPEWNGGITYDNRPSA